MGGQNVDISIVLIAFSEMHVFLATLFFMISLICLQEILNSEDFGGSI